ncbi:hypothetical protein TNCV_2697071 [Trichonephila clavipes]|nr:hypothetical protein TNCV_2697071 [Trichonephila clavipes]
MNKNQSNFTKPIHQSESAFDHYGVRQPPIPHTDERRPVSEITPPQGEAGGGKRPNEDETGERHEIENGRAQEGGWNEKERSLQGKLTDDTAGVTKLEPALTLFPVLMRGKCISML